VALPTVTAIFGTKRGLLEALIALVVRGDAAPEPLLDRSWFRAVLEEPDPVRQLRLHAANARLIQERSADIAEIVKAAATADGEIASVLRHLGAGRLRDTRTVVESLHAKGALRADLTVERATDLLWTLTSSDVFRLLVVERGWPPADYERWLGDETVHSLLGRETAYP
jgi:hypothetical protein